MKSLLVWIFTALVFTAVGGLCVYAAMHAQDENRKKKEHPATASAPAEKEEKISHDDEGYVVIALDKDAQDQLNIEVKALEAATHHPETTAFGSLLEDPARTFTLRAPLPGVLHPAGDQPWPALGGEIAEGAVIGNVEPRLGPVDMADMSAKLATARSEMEQSEASLQVLRASLASKQQLHEQDKIVSDLAVQEAEAQVKGELAKLRGAQETARVIESFLSSANKPSDAIKLLLPMGGRVMEISGQPGESVESGYPVLKVARFDRLLARVSLPGGEVVGADVAKARLTVSGHETVPLDAERVSMAPLADPLTGGQTMLFSVKAGDFPLQPGMSVVARLQLPGEAQEGVSIPRSAIVRVSGQGWVYVRVEEEKFTRFPIPMDISTPEGWFASKGFKPGDEVVIRGAQAILSEELKFASHEEEE